MTATWRSISAALAAALLVVPGCSPSPDGPHDAADTEGDRRGTGTAGTPVGIPTDDLELAGLLRLPEGAGPHPGTVIVHGSGPLDRTGAVDGQLGLTFPRRVPIYEQLAVGLQERGIAVLTWDKRSCGPFNGCADNDHPRPDDDHLTIDTFIADVDAAVDLLHAHGDIDEVAIIGHSQGGTLALHVAAARTDVAAVVTVGTPVAGIDELLADQADRLAELARAAGQEAAAAGEVAAMREMVAQLAEVRAGVTDGAPIGGTSRRFWASWLDASDTAAALTDRIDADLLVLGGEHDWNVSPSRVEAWADHLGDRGEIRILPRITHVLTELRVSDPTAIRADDVGLEVAPVVTDTIADWLKRSR